MGIYFVKGVDTHNVVCRMGVIPKHNEDYQMDNTEPSPAAQRLARLHAFEAERRQVWSNAWAMTANANDCKSAATATHYADACLREFDKRFASAFI